MRQITLRVGVLISLLASSIAIFMIYYSVDDPDEFIRFFGSNIRNNLFGGFLSVSALMLSLKTFIIVKLKEHVYDTKGYKKIVTEYKNRGSKTSHYRPLKKLSDLLYYTILSSILTAAAQLTIGLIDHWGAAIFCCAVSVFTTSLFIMSLMIIKISLDDMFAFLEEEN